MSRRAWLILLAVVGTLAWGGLSVLMVVWGVAGIVLACLAVATAAAIAITIRR